MYVRFNTAAQRELIDTVNFYDQQVGGLGEEFFSEVQQFVALLTDNPALGKRGPDDRAGAAKRYPGHQAALSVPGRNFFSSLRACSTGSV